MYNKGMIKENSNSKDLLLHAIRVPEDPDILGDMLYELAQERRLAHVKDVKENGQLAPKEANDFIVNYLATKHTYKTEDDELFDKKEILKALRVVVCDELGIDTAQVPFYFGTKENDSVIIREKSQATTVMGDGFSTDNNGICGLIAMNKQWVKDASAIDLIRIVSHEFGHIAQTVLNKKLQSNYNGNIAQSRDRSSPIFKFLWNASPAEKDADNYAFAKTTHFLSLAAKKGGLNGALFISRINNTMKKVKSNSQHAIASALYSPYKKIMKSKSQSVDRSYQ